MSDNSWNPPSGPSEGDDTGRGDPGAQGPASPSRPPERSGDPLGGQQPPPSPYSHPRSDQPSEQSPTEQSPTEQSAHRASARRAARRAVVVRRAGRACRVGRCRAAFAGGLDAAVVAAAERAAVRQVPAAVRGSDRTVLVRGPDAGVGTLAAVRYAGEHLVRRADPGTAVLAECLDRVALVPARGPGTVADPPAVGPDLVPITDPTADPIVSPVLGSAVRPVARRIRPAVRPVALGAAHRVVRRGQPAGIAGRPRGGRVRRSRPEP